MTDTLTITRPDDWHIHFRDGAVMHSVLPDTARVFARAIAMPNLKPPVVSVADAAAYHERLLAAVPPGVHFQPLMTLYLTDNTRANEIVRARASEFVHARASEFVHAVKYYPAGATTNSDAGVTDLRRCEAVFAAMEASGMPLLVHGEVTDPAVDIFDREAVFIDRVLLPLLDRHPRLKVVFEHITTQQAVDFVRSANSNIAATITAHHLLYNRNAMFKGGLRPHLYCLPVLKREAHRRALIEAATSGNAKFFLGTDSAPHAQGSKESACGCAGIYTAHAAIELYAEAFEDAGALDKLEAFASFYGADFYGLPRNRDTITLCRQTWQVPATLTMGNEFCVPLRAGESIRWQCLS